MVRRALSLRRGHAALTLDSFDATSTGNASAVSAASPPPPYVTIPVIITTSATGSARREALPLSRHHQLRRSSSVSSRSTASSCFGGREGEDGRSVVVGEEIEEGLEG